MKPRWHSATAVNYVMTRDCRFNQFKWRSVSARIVSVRVMLKPLVSCRVIMSSDVSFSYHKLLCQLSQHDTTFDPTSVSCVRHEFKHGTKSCCTTLTEYLLQSVFIPRSQIPWKYGFFQMKSFQNDRSRFCLKVLKTSDSTYNLDSRADCASRHP